MGDAVMDTMEARLRAQELWAAAHGVECLEQHKAVKLRMDDIADDIREQRVLQEARDQFANKMWGVLIVLTVALAIGTKTKAFEMFLTLLGWAG